MAILTKKNLCRPLSRFDVTEGPRYGRIERLRGNGRWVSTKRFFSRQLEKEKVRYVHTKGTPARDSFTFAASARSDDEDANAAAGSVDEHRFEIDFITLEVQALRNNPVRMMSVSEAVITDTHLMYQTFPQSSPDAEIFYSIETPPRHGMLLLTVMPSGEGTHQQDRELRTGSTFSQVDLLAGFLKYRMRRKVSQPLDDSFTFVVQTSEQKSAIQTFHLRHVPGDADVDIDLERLEVEEGGKKTVTTKYIRIQVSDIRHFVFNVTRTPRHGQIDILAANRVDVARANSTFFTSEELEAERVVYKHDDSESRRDTFHFLVTSASQSRHDFQYLAVLHILVLLRNDQTPTRVVDKVFEVMEGGQKLLTSSDLRFIDLDIDTRPEDIKYNHHAIPNGELVLVENPTQPVFTFTQRDLDERRILFKHLGANFGRIMLWVSDGQYFVSTELKVRASPPFIKIVNNTGLIVQRYESGFVTPANLSVETNLNVRDRDLIFEVSADGAPTIGELLRDDVPVSVFSAADIAEERIEYRNNRNGIAAAGEEIETTKDQFAFTARVADGVTIVSSRFGAAASSSTADIATVSGLFTLHVFPENYWEPLEIASNNSLLVEESTSIAITQKDLQVRAQMESLDIRE